MPPSMRNGGSTFLLSTLLHLTWILVLAAPLWALFPFQGRAAPDPDWQRVHSLTLHGIEQLYNLEVDSALQTFRQVSTLAPTDPRGHFFEAMVSFWKSNLLGEENEYEHFLALADTVIDVCESVLDGNSNNAAARFFLGGMYGYRGMARRTHGSMIQAVFDGRKGYINLEEALRADPAMYDAQMGLGLFEYLIAKAPKSLSWLLSTIGYPGSIDGGLAALKLAADKGTYARTEAKFFLAQFLFNEHRRDEAFQVMHELTEQYPRNTLFLLNNAVMFRRNGDYDSALVLTERAMSINARRHTHYGEEFAYSTLASIQFLQNNFEGARDNFRLYMEKIANKALITNSILYRYGVAQELMGDRAGAVRTYAQVKEPLEDVPWEQRSAQLCRFRLERPMTSADIELLKADNLLECRRYASADSLLTLLLSTPRLDPDVEAEGLYDLARICFTRKDDSSAIVLASRIAAVNVRRESWLYPSALLLVGRSYARTGRKEQARAAYERALDFSDYDSEASIRRQIKEEMDRLSLP
jgi:tetratricopeptide (TPR) repeat protein